MMSDFDFKTLQSAITVAYELFNHSSGDEDEIKRMWSHTNCIEM